MYFEIELIKFFQNGQNAFFDLFFWFFSFFAGIFGAILIVVFFYLFKNKKFAIYFLICFLINVGINYLLKCIINRPRPYEISDIINLNQAIGKSFPSGHMVGATTIIVFIIYYIFTNFKSKQTRLISIILSGLFLTCVAISRMYFGQHYLSDLIVGMVIAILFSVFELSFYKKRHSP